MGGARERQGALGVLIALVVSDQGNHRAEGLAKAGDAYSPACDAGMSADRSDAAR